MKKKSIFQKTFLSAIFSACVFASGIAKETKPDLMSNRLDFIENKGQVISPEVDHQVLYYVHGNNVQCFLKDNGLSYVWKTVASKYFKKQATSYQIDLEFLNSNKDVKVHAEEMSKCVSNFYLSNCPKGILDVNSFRKVIYENIYDKIDLVFYVADGDEKDKQIPIKYDFIVKPGGNPDQIKINYVGNKGLKIKQDGSLHVTCPLGELKEGKPYTYQRKDDISRNEIKATFKVEENQILSFNVGDYDKEKELVIDPSVQWGTYYCGITGASYNGAVTADAAGNTYLYGQTSTASLATAGAYQTSVIGTSNLIIVKFDANGARQWATYYGNGATTSPQNHPTICVNPNGPYLYLIGNTSSATGIATAGAPQTTYGGGTEDGFLLKMNIAGAVQWCTYIGGSGRDNLHRFHPLIAITMKQED
ncbi:MAG TPA: hypothetical protein VLB84_10050 [Bacteroidia bacterium]|nr:hypothetical protein [Bacteroidia bacterium]